MLINKVVAGDTDLHDKQRSSWLVISYFANVDGMAASHHIDDKLPLFKKRGINISLISSPCGALYNDFQHIRIPSFAPSGIRYEIRYFLKKKTHSNFWYKFWTYILLLPVYPFYMLEKMFLRLDSTWSWFIGASIAALLTALKNRPSIIYSTGGPVSAHITAMIASYITKIPHIAELQDPLLIENITPSKLEEHFMRKVEKLISKTAHTTAFLTKKAAENAGRRNHFKGKVVTIYPGAVPRNGFVKEYTKSEKINIAHFGSLNGSRNLHCLFQALTEVFAEDEDIIGSVVFHICGSIGKNVSRQIGGFAYKEVLHIHGKVGRNKVEDLMYGKADVLLLIQNTEELSFETIPLKTYEYLHAGKPILALVYMNPELQSMLEGMGHIVVQADDVHAIKKGIMTYFLQWRQNQLAQPIKGSPYTVERAVDELIGLVNNL